MLVIWRIVISRMERVRNADSKDSVVLSIDFVQPFSPSLPRRLARPCPRRYPPRLHSILNLLTRHVPPIDGHNEWRRPDLVCRTSSRGCELATSQDDEEPALWAVS